MIWLAYVLVAQAFRVGRLLRDQFAVPVCAVVARAMPRAKSCPATTRTEVARPADLSNSNGCGGSSPTSWVQLSKIWLKLFRTWLFFMPQVRVEVWHGHLYAALWWAPQRAPLAVLDASRWHTTLLRGFSTTANAIPVAVLAHWTLVLQTVLDAMLAPMRSANGEVPVLMQFPPRHWPRSWTFGVPQKLEFMHAPLHDLLRLLASQHDPAMWFADTSPQHVSWN